MTSTSPSRRGGLRQALALVLAFCVTVASQATVGLGLQRQLGNPSGATTDANNHSNYLMDRAQFSLDYDDVLRQPNWVAWNLTAGDHGTVPRSNFIPDPDLPAGFYAVVTGDYNGVGDPSVNLNRGHMCPSADRNDTTTNNQVAFYMTNIVPQAADNNQGPWEVFETEERNLAAAGNELLIISGPSIFTGAKIPSGVADIPNYVWKIAVVVPSGPGTALSRITASTRVIALKMPNVNGIRSTPWTDFIVSAAEIEADTGFHFFTELPASVADALRAKIDGGSTGTVPVIVTQPTSQTALINGSATFTVAATGGGLSYQWRKDGDEITGAVNPTLTLTNVQPTDAGAYDVVVTNTNGAVTSNAATLTITLPVAPAITGQPQNATVTAGNSAIFSVTATGTPSPTYQWFKVDLGNAITQVTGATSATLTLANVQPADSGNRYYVVATNSAGSASSNLALLTVQSVPPSIATQPASQTVVFGSNVTFTVSANGTDPLFYQWRRNGTALGGQTAASLNLSGVQASDGGSYDVTVTNAGGSVTSTLAVLSLTSAATTTTTTQVLYAGGTYSQNFDGLPSSGSQISIAGSGPVYFNASPVNATNLGGWSFAKGSGTGTNTLLNMSDGSGSTPTGSVYSYGVSGSTERALGSLASGTTISRFGATFVNNTGTTINSVTISYTGEQWRRGDNVANTLTFSYAIGGTDISTGTFVGAPALNFTSPVTTGSNVALVGNNSPNRTSISAPISVTWAPGQTLVLRWNDSNDAGNDDGIAIDNFSLSTAVGVPTVAVASTSPAADATNVGTALPITVTFNQAVTATGNWATITSALTGPVTATVTGGPTTYTLTPTGGLAYNDTISVTLNAAQIVDQATGTTHPTSNYAWSFKTSPPTPPSIATQPVSQAVIAGTTATFSVTATGTAPLSYQWRKDGASLGNGGIVSGANTATLTLTGVALTDGGSYDVVVNNVTNSPVTSNAATLTVTNSPIAPSIATQPVSQTVSLGGTVAFSVTAGGTTPLNYQWRRNGSPIAGANASTLTLANVTFLNAGSYDVVVSNASSSTATSNPATLTVNTASGASVVNFTGGTYAQNFNSLPSTGTFSFSGNGPFSLDAAAPNGVGAAGLGGWSIAKYSGSGSNVIFRVDTGTNTSGGISSYGSTAATDRALGSLASGSVISRFGVMIVNNTGSTINQFTVGFTGEQWRHGGGTTPNLLSFSYAIGGTDINTGTFVDVSSMNFPSPIFVGTSGALDGNSPPNRSAVGGQITGISWAPGQVLVLRWTDADDSSGDDGISIDDFSFTTAAPVAPVVTTAPTPQTITSGGSATFSVAATGLPALVYQWRRNGVVLANGGVVSGAATSTLTLTGAKAANAGDYDVLVSNGITTVASAPATLTVNKAAATVTLVPASLTATYNGSPKAATATTSPSGLSVSLTYDGNATAPTNAGSYAVVATIVDNDYAGSASGTLVISPVTSMITWPAPAPIVFGTPLGAAQLNATANTAGTFTYTPAAGTILNAGNGQVLGVSFTPADAVNYTSATATRTIDVSPATATVTFTDLNQTYNGTPRPVTATVSPLEVGFVVKYDGSTIAPTAAGTYNVVATLTNSNYVGGGSATLTVAKAQPTVTWSAPSAITYGTALSATQLNATADVAGTLTYTPAAGTVLNAGANQTLSVSFAPADAANYNSASATTTITVNKATPVLTWSAPAAITYGTALGATQLNATADVGGTFAYTPAAGTVLNAGANQTLSVSFAPTDAANYNSASATTTITVNKATPVLTWSAPAAITYGTALGATQLNATADVGGTLTYTPAAGTVLNAGPSQTLSVSFAPTDAANYNSASATTTITVNKATPVATWSAPAPIIYGAALSATQLNATANVGGTFAYTPAAGTILNAGANQPLAAVFTPTDAVNYTTASANTAITVNKATPTLTWPAPMGITYGTALGAAQLNATANVPGTFTYTPPAGTVLNAGANQTLSVAFAPTDATNYNDASATTTITVAKFGATIALSNLRQAYDGAPKPVTVTTTPGSLNVVVTYNGNTTVPSLPGSYAVVATINDGNNAGTATGTLVVTVTALVRHGPNLNGDIDGSLQVLLPESFTLNGNAMISGDALVPGLPTVRLNGNPTYAGTVDGNGDSTPANYQVTLNGNTVLRHVVRRTNAIALPTVDAPPAPAGTRSVTINAAGQSAGDFATLRNLTLNGNAGQMAVPAGTYGNFIANGGSGFTLGDANATTPTVYNFQSLTLNGSAQLQIVGPVVINLANGVTLNANVGASGHADWLTLNVASGGVTLNGNVHVHANVVAPNGTVTINGGSTLDGDVAADRLTINGGGTLNEP